MLKPGGGAMISAVPRNATGLRSMVTAVPRQFWEDIAGKGAFRGPITVMASDHLFGQTDRDLVYFTKA